MKKSITLGLFLLSSLSYSQTLVKLSGGLGNRWDEKLNSQTIGKGFRLSAEAFITPHFSIGAGMSYFSFDPTTLVNVRFNSYSLQGTYYFTQGKLQPFAGIEAGFCSYADKVTLELPSGNSSQQRNKNYGSISPKAGLLYNLSEQIGIHFQLSTDFVPVSTVAPIGFASANLGISYRFKAIGASYSLKKNVSK